MMIKWVGKGWPMVTVVKQGWYIVVAGKGWLMVVDQGWWVVIIIVKGG